MTTKYKKYKIKHNSIFYHLNIEDKFLTREHLNNRVLSPFPHNILTSLSQTAFPRSIQLVFFLLPLIQSHTRSNSLLFALIMSCLQVIIEPIHLIYRPLMSRCNCIDYTICKQHSPFLPPLTFSLNRPASPLPHPLPRSLSRLNV